MGSCGGRDVVPALCKISPKIIGVVVCIPMLSRHMVLSFTLTYTWCLRHACCCTVQRSGHSRSGQMCPKRACMRVLHGLYCLCCLPCGNTCSPVHVALSFPAFGTFFRCCWMCILPALESVQVVCLRLPFMALVCMQASKCSLPSCIAACFHC